MGFFDKIKQGLTKTKTKMDAQLTGIFAAYEPGDEEFFEDLEETLILADTGVETTTKAIAQLRKAIELKKLRTGAEVKKEFVQILTRILKVQDTMLLLTTQPSVVLVVGVNGVGKTTTIGKLAAQLKKEGNRILLSAADTFRAAAADQLTVWAQRAGVDIVKHEEGSDPAAVVFDSIQAAKARGTDVVIIDTAGRLHIDEALMTELQNIKAAVNPAEILLVIDAMIGQDAVATAQAFDDALDITGVMLTKLDGDARGGAALSIKALTGKPIKFAGIGEKLDQIEPFHPDRMASRILGMGDVLTLIEKAEQNLDQKKAEEMAERLRQNRFTLTDYYDQLQQLKGMGSLQDIAGMIPGMDAKALSGANVDEKAMGRIEAIIQSMTPGERDNPAILNSSRKKRIAAGAGTSVVEINKLLKQFELMQQLVRQMSGNSKAMKRMKRGGRGGFGGLGNLFGGGGGRPYGF